VDEFQDTNLAQYAILRLLAQKHRNLYVVGDEDQSIYRWRGADYRNILRFQQDFKDTKILLLEQNYRSTQTILDGAMAVIDHNHNRTAKKLFTDAKKGEKINLLIAQDDREEAEMVVSEIERAITHQKISPGAFAIMYRTNAQSRLLEEAFRRAGLNYRLVGAQRFYGRREVKDIIAYMRLVYNPLDEISMRRVINLPPRGIGDKTIEKVAELADHENLSVGEILLGLAKGNPAWQEALGREATRLISFGRMLQSWRECAEKNRITVLFDRILEDIGYQAHIQDQSEEGLDRWENVLELRAVVLEYEEQGLQAFLESMALVADQDTLPENVDAPTLLTLHAARDWSRSGVHHRFG